MRIETTSRELYPFEELSDKAKEKAREWMRQCNQGDNFFSECVIDDFVTIAENLGWTIPKSRHNSGHAVYWSGFWSQGDGACFEGYWSMTNLDAAKVKAERPKDAELHRLADGFAAVAARISAEKNEDDPYASVKQRGLYYHSFSTEFETQGMSAACEETLIELSRDLMSWLYASLEKEWEYQNSDSCIDENIRANEYEFTVEGKRA